MESQMETSMETKTIDRDDAAVGVDGGGVVTAGVDDEMEIDGVVLCSEDWRS